MRIMNFNGYGAISDRISTILMILFLPFFSLFQACSKDDPNPYPSPDPYIEEVVSSIQADSLRKTATWLQQMQTRFFLANNHREVARLIQNRFIQLGYPNTRLDSFQLSVNYSGTLYQTWQYNVIATLEGSEHKKTINIVGAHYDCIVEDGDPFLFAPGADDNACGVAAVIEIARIFRSFSIVPATSIQFILFAAEENNLDGSADYCRKVQNTGNHIGMMLNNDMIGYQPDGNPSGWSVNIMNYPNSWTLPEDATRICQQYTSLSVVVDNTYNEEGDSYSFSENGIPALFFISSADNQDYHSVNDQIDNCNFLYCSEITKISLALLMELSR